LAGSTITIASAVAAMKSSCDRMVFGLIGDGRRSQLPW
jgi:hypothetical protein